MCGTVARCTLTCGRSIAVLGLGLGMKGARRWIISAIFVVAITTLETVEAVAVVRRWFVQVHQLQLLVMASWVMLAEMVSLVEGTLVVVLSSCERIFGPNQTGPVNTPILGADPQGTVTGSRSFVAQPL
jgi:hypothetical protein